MKIVNWADETFNEFKTIKIVDKNVLYAKQNKSVRRR